MPRILLTNMATIFLLSVLVAQGIFMKEGVGMRFKGRDERRREKERERERDDDGGRKIYK